MEEQNIVIIGSGRMGIGIATALLIADQGLSINLVDCKKRRAGQENDSLDSARNEIVSNLNLLKRLGEIRETPQKLIKKLNLSRNLEDAVAGSAYIFEALPEKPELKQELIVRIEPIIPETAIIASATSTIGLETFWEVSSRPEMIITAHWLNPAFIIPLVEISIGRKTGDRVAEKTKEFFQRMGKVPVVIKEGPGFIVPRIQVAAMNEAVRIVEEGIATPDDVDTAIKAGFGFRLAVLGLIEFIDLGGLDILYYASNYLSQKLGQAQYQPPKSVVEKMDKGEIGPRAGKGYFDYSGVNIEALFEKRYRGFVELLNLVKSSQELDFKGGIGD